jgi:hypothetical protein
MRKKLELTKEYLKECLTYNIETGIFTWKYRPLHHFKNAHGMNTFNSKFSGKELTSIGKKGYIRAWLNGGHFYAHRLVWLYVYGYLHEKEIDHISCIRIDNRLCNLRGATHSQNRQNMRKAPSTNKSTWLIGSSYSKKYNCFKSQIRINKKVTTLGFFDTALDAHNAYIQAKRKYHEFCTL